MSDTDSSQKEPRGEKNNSGAESDATMEIVTQPRSFSSEQAVEQLSGRFAQRLRQVVSDDEVARTELRYKPYFEFDATLRKKIFRGEDQTYDGAIIVDGFTGVARPILHEQVETERRTVQETLVLEPDIVEQEARNRANRNRIKVQQRESGKIELGDEPHLVYKPLWLIERDTGEVDVVDATNGQVFGNGLI